MRKTGIIILIVILVLLVMSLTNMMIAMTRGGSNMWGGFGRLEKIEQNIRKEETIDITDTKNIDIQFASSDVNIIMTDDTQIRVVEYTNKEVDRDMLFTVNKTANDIRITEGEFKFHFMLFNWTQISYDIYIPKTYIENLKIRTASGNFKMDQDINMKNIEINLTSGEIKINANVKGESVSLKTVSGRIRVQEIQAEELSIISTSGEAEVQKIEAKTATIHTTSGEIKVDNIQADSECKSVSGNIRINRAKGALNLKTTSGGITIQNFEITGDTEAISTSGNINIYLNSESNCEMKAKTTSGITRFPNDSSIMGNAPYHILNMKTTSGNIKIGEI